MLITVAIIEDLDEVREGLENFISNDPEFAVIKAFSNAEEALALLPELQPDIVIMDINLPGMNGIKCIELVKEKCSHTQFMMFTVYENDEKVFDALKAGASGYLLKKTSPAKIIEALRELFDGGSPMSSNIARKLVTNYYTKETTASVSSLLLSPRENEILQWLSKGLLYKEIAEKLSIATGTVRQHIHKMYDKLHVQNRTEAINKTMEK
ncbi:MAG: response regulator transcription factor [Chitinophagaceae bacterium]|jgi:DNA-binding NarL/FixJ family response regulator|nr:response regulator transcription factor [Chitinophagaceae bacterium]